MRLFIASPVILNNYIAIQNDFEGIIDLSGIDKELQYQKLNLI